MIQQTYTTRVLVPDEGNYLTQIEEVPVPERIFSKKIFLAYNDSPANWKEITEAEAEELKAQQKELEKQENEQTN